MGAGMESSTQGATRGYSRADVAVARSGLVRYACWQTAPTLQPRRGAWCVRALGTP
jgi:hypothetical protein